MVQMPKEPPRGQGQVGFICTHIRSAFPDEARYCGIGEWRAKGTLVYKSIYIVYVGSTCRSKPGALRGRINEYCMDGLYKDLMNEALTVMSLSYGLVLRSRKERMMLKTWRTSC